MASVFTEADFQEETKPRFTEADFQEEAVPQPTELTKFPSSDSVKASTQTRSSAAIQSPPPIAPPFESPIQITPEGPVYKSQLEDQKYGALRESNLTGGQKLRRTSAAESLLGPPPEELEAMGGVAGSRAGVIPTLAATTPLLPVGLGGLAGKAVFAYFAQDLIRQQPEIYKQAKDAADRGDWDTFKKVVGEDAFAAALTALGGRQIFGRPGGGRPMPDIETMRRANVPGNLLAERTTPKPVVTVAPEQPPAAPEPQPAAVAPRLEAPAVVPAETSKASPNELVPALKTSDGKIIPGAKGNTHGDIYNAQGEIPGLELKVSQPEHGFLYNGQWKSRREAANLLGEKDDLHSETLIELQNKAAEPVSRPAPVEDAAGRLQQLKAFTDRTPKESAEMDALLAKDKAQKNKEAWQAQFKADLEKQKAASAPPAPPAAPVAPELGSPASSQGLSAPVDLSKPTAPKKAYSGLVYRAPVQEFTDLIMQHGADHGWIDHPDFIAPGATGPAMISHNTEMAKAFRRAFKQLGIDTDRNTLKQKALALPKLKAFLEAHAKTVPESMENIKDGATFTIAGEKYKAKETNPDTGLVTLVDGKTLKVPMEGSVKIDPGSLKNPEGGEDFPGGETAAGMKLDQPESVEQQNARVEAEKATALKKSQGEAVQAGSAKPLVGSVGNIGQRDMFGGNDLFGMILKPVDAATASLVNPPNLTVEMGSGISLSGVTDAVKSAARYLGELHRQELGIPKMTDLRRSILNWSAKLQRSFGEAAAKQKNITRRVPNPIRREGITNWIQAEGDLGVLASRRAATISWRDRTTGKPHPDAKRLIAGYDAAIHLTPDEIAVANEVKSDYGSFAARGQSSDVLGALKDNYVTQTWNLNKGPGGPGGPGGTGTGRTLKEKFRFSRARTFASYFDGEQAGYSPKTKDIARLLPMYSHEMNSVIAAKELVAQMGTGKGSDGRPLLAPKGVGVPIDSADGGKATLVMPKVGAEETSDYKVLANQPALSGWKWVSKDSAGNPVFLKADLALHPEAFKKLRAVLGRSAIREWYGASTSALAEIPKGIVKGIDMANSETKRTMLGMLATFHQIQTGTHAVGHRVNPTFGIPKVDLVGNAEQMDAAKHGLMMLPDKASENQFMEGFRTSGLISKIPGIGPIADWYSNYLFTQYIPGLKFKTYQAILKRNLGVYDRQLKSGSVSPEDVKVLSSEQANAAYGHINYADLGRNPTMQHIAQLGLLAPDFLEARGRFAGQAIKGVTGAKVGREQLLALATLAIAQGVLAYTIAHIVGGEWNGSRPFEFTLGNRRYTMRSVPEDTQNLITHTRQFIHSRLSPLIGKGFFQYLSGVDYRGRKVSAGQTTKELAAQPIPLTVRGFSGFGNSTLSGLEQLAGSLGLRISRYSPMMDVHDLVVDFKKGSNDPKLQSQIELQEQEVFASPYEKLRATLHTGDLSAARKEYDSILKIRTAEQVDNAMKPWTGGKLNRETGMVSEKKPKPFTGSSKTERQFLNSLTPDQRRTYLKATEERAKFYQTFRQMLSQPR